MTITAKYPGKCSACDGAVKAGERIEWDKKAEKGKSVRHTRCAAKETPEVNRPKTFAPTGEQLHALELFATGQNMAIEAGAGTGKTSTLILLAESTPRRGQYIAFNKAIVAEAGEKFPGTVNCSTAHSLAFQAVGRDYRERLGNSRRMRSDAIALKLGINPFSCGEKTLGTPYLGGLVMAAVTRFCQSADMEPSEKHVPYVAAIDELRDGARTYSNNNHLQRYIIPYVKKAWADLINPNGALPFKHDHYLKIWHLSGPRISADYILFDEAQDANPVLLAIVGAQTHAQRVYVGDTQQCQPAGTLVTVVDSYKRGNRRTGVIPATYRQIPIEDILPGDCVVTFDVAKSFLRRMGATVSRVAARDFSGDLFQVQVGSRFSKYTPEHRCVVRVGDAFGEKWLVYLMRKGHSFRVGLVRGVYETQSGMIGLPMRLYAEGADAAWVLSSHDSEAEARVAETICGYRYHLPTLRFRQGTERGISQDALDGFWSAVGDLSEKATSCLEDHGRKIALPLITRESRLYRRRSQIIAACNLMNGMLMLPFDGAMSAEGKQVAQKSWLEIKVGRVTYTGKVHSLEVEQFGTYVADGIVTHNCIYGFTGAINALDRIRECGGETALLTQSFRFGPAIAEVANNILDMIDGAMLRLVGTDSILSVIRPIAEPNAILCRTNAAAVRTVISIQKDNRIAALVGGGDEVVRFAKGAHELMEKGSTEHPDLACFDSWAAVSEYVAQDEQGGELRLMVKLVDDFGVETILAALDRAVRESDADVIVSTAHKSKGREWASVQLAGDFLPVAKMGTDELRLLYVSVTRAKRDLDITAIDFGKGGPESEEGA